LVIGSSPSTPDEKRSYGEDGVGRRVKIYWPLDKVWYEGSVKSFDKDANKHLVQYDDAEEELLDLEKEKIEWLDESGKKKLKRLRRGSSDSKDGEEVEIVKEEACVEEFKRPQRRGGKVVVEDEEVESDGGGVDGHDDSSDEDWGKNVEEEVVEDGEDDMDLEEEEDEGVKASKGKRDGLKKRKVSEGEKLGSAKKSKNGSGGGGGGVGKGGLKVSSVEPAGNGENM
jgi:DNA mismatch repair protein MSH6